MAIQKGELAMNKDEILKKARNQKQGKLDEMDVLMKSHQIGLMIGLILCLIIVGLKIYLKQPHQDILSVVCATLCGRYLYDGIRMKNMFHIVAGVIWGILSVTWIIEYFI